MNGKQQPKPSLAQRQAQSARDKAMARRGAQAPRARAGRVQRVFRPAGGPSVPPVVGFFAPVAEGTIMKSARPTFQRSTFNSQRIVHREKVAKLTTPGTGAFTILGTFPINPGMLNSFPWLANEARGWESYRFNRLRYLWVPTAGTAVAGNIIIAPDYDAADGAPLGETFMSTYSDAEEANVWARFAAEMSVDLLNGESRRKFIRTGALSANLDIKTYDSGNLYVASTDDAAANSGKLWVEYDVTLYNPQTPGGGFQSAGYLYAATGGSAAAPFTGSVTSNGGLSISAANLVVTVANVEAGQVFGLASAINGTVITAWSVAATTGCVANTLNQADNINAAQTQATLMRSFTATAANPTITFTCTATTVTKSVITAQINAPALVY